MIMKFRETKLWKSHWSEQKNGKIAHEAEINVYYLMQKRNMYLEIVCKLVRQEEGVSSDFCTL